MDREPLRSDRPDPLKPGDLTGEATTSSEVSSGGTVTCPEQGCSTRFACDACLDEHLRSIHEETYLGTFGDVAQSWVTLCEGHTEFPLDRITNG